MGTSHYHISLILTGHYQGIFTLYRGGGGGGGGGVKMGT